MHRHSILFTIIKGNNEFTSTQISFPTFSYAQLNFLEDSYTPLSDDIEGVSKKHSIGEGKIVLIDIVWDWHSMCT
jgi:hypothetical protein